MEDIIAREKQVETLEHIYASNKAELIAIYGRRRIGKTFLIDQFFRRKGLFFNISGIKKGSLQVHLHNFATALSDTFTPGITTPTPKTWVEAFTMLRKQIEQIDSKRRIVLFLDEFPWLATPRSGFLTAFDYFWNQYMSRDKRVIVVICGSAAAWMIRNVIHSRGGLHGRVTQKIRLRPFNLNETERYLQSLGVRLDRKQIIEIYMAVGGVAQYLSQIRPGQSSAQAIQELCFTEDGYLTHEFYHIYASLFDNYELHVEVVKLLANCSRPLSRQEILDKLRLSSGNRITKVLRELEESSLILGVPPFKSQKGGLVYQLIDPFTLFYLQWIDKKHLQMVEENYWTNQQKAPVWSSWAGHVFETICLVHTKQIKMALGISGVCTSQSHWTYRAKPASGEIGAQIDLVIDRADGCINLCEIKFCQKEFIINRVYAENLEHKRLTFAEKTRTKKALFTTLITLYGAVRNMHYLGSVDKQITMEALFGSSNQ